MVVLAAIVVFAAIAFLVLGLFWKQENAMSARIAGLRGEQPFVDFRVERQISGSITGRLFGPMANSLGAKAQQVLPARWIQGIDRRLVMAGQPATTTGFLIAVILVEGAMLAMGFTILISSDSRQSALMLVGALAFFGLLMPKIWLDNRVRHRQKDILKSLPDAFDLITTCVEAGLGLEAALAKVAEQTEGPFGEELAVSLREVALGKLRRDALKELTLRTGVPDLTSFINAVIQAESMGTSIATVLRVQAEQMRTKRRQRAEQQAQAAPIKMMFPLVLCIFPSLFIVILGPAVISIYETLVAKE